MPSIFQMTFQEISQKLLSLTTEVKYLIRYLKSIKRITESFYGPNQWTLEPKLNVDKTFT